MTVNILQRAGEFARFVGQNNPDKLLEVRNPARRLLLQGAMATKLLPLLFGRYYNRKDYSPIEHFGLSVIGRGHHSIAAHDPKTDTVIKFHYRHSNHTEAEMEQMVRELEGKQQKCLSTLGAIAVSQTYEIDSSPYNPSRPIIIARQQFIPTKRAIMLADIPRQGIRSIPDIREFMAGNTKMLYGHRAVADIFGHGNLVVNNDNELKLVDPIPLVAEEASQARYHEAKNIVKEISDALVCNH